MMKTTVAAVLLVISACASDEETGRRIAEMEQRVSAMDAAHRTALAAVTARLQAAEDVTRKLQERPREEASSDPSWWCGPSWCGRGKALCEKTSKQSCEQRPRVYCAIVAFSTLRTSVGMLYGDTACAPTHETCVKGLAEVEGRAPYALDNDRCLPFGR